MEDFNSMLVPALAREQEELIRIVCQTVKQTLTTTCQRSFVFVVTDTPVVLSPTVLKAYVQPSLLVKVERKALVYDTKFWDEICVYLTSLKGKANAHRLTDRRQVNYVLLDLRI